MKFTVTNPHGIAYDFGGTQVKPGAAEYELTPAAAQSIRDAGLTVEAKPESAPKARPTKPEKPEPTGGGAPAAP